MHRFLDIAREKSRQTAVENATHAIVVGVDNKNNIELENS